MRRLALALLPLLVPVHAGAQIIRGRLLSQPSTVVSLGVARQGAFALRDGSTGSEWRFGDAVQFTGSLEKIISPGLSLGLSGGTAHTPVTIVADPSLSPISRSGDADAIVSQLFATIYATGGSTLHTVLEGDIGATVYSSFQPRPGSLATAPTGADTDFAFAIGYGFGYSFSPRFSIDFVQTVGTSMHQKTGLSAGEDSSVRINSSRLVARFGLGTR